MKTALAASTALVLVGTSLAAVAQTDPATAGHTIITPQDVKWSAAPPVLPKGAEAALLYGDPTKEGPFVLRVKFPGDYHVPPHTHPVDELVTVVSGTFKLGMGDSADEAKAQALPAGSFFGLAPEMPHFVYTDEETVIQISTVGPWALNYLDPKDDPRQQTQ